MHVLVITPIYAPTVGGAATYYSLLTEGLLTSREVTKITIITERVPGQPNREKKYGEKLDIIRMFPHRAGRYLSPLLLYWRYALQNFQYFFLPLKVLRIEPDIMLVHSSLHIYPNFFQYLVRFFNSRFPVVADIRDTQLDVTRFRQLDLYASLIVCSLNIKTHISQHPSLTIKAKYIPVIQQRISSERPNLLNTLNRYKLQKRCYFLFVGLIKRSKGLGLLLEVYIELCTRGFKADLVLVGFSKDENLKRQLRSTPGVRMIGALPREEILDLMSEAMLNINISPSEGMPRSSLEALALRAPVLLPSGIPEFDKYCGYSVVKSSKKSDIADQILNLLKHNDGVGHYPIEVHETKEIIPQYIKLFQSQIALFKK